jgi:hypothetical protein
MPEKIARCEIAVRRRRGKRHLDGDHFAEMKDLRTSGCPKIHAEARSLVRESGVGREDCQ